MPRRLRRTPANLPAIPPSPSRAQEKYELSQREAYAIPAETASRIQRGRTVEDRVAGERELLSNERYRRSRGLIGSGHPLTPERTPRRKGSR